MEVDPWRGTAVIQATAKHTSISVGGLPPSTPGNGLRPAEDGVSVSFRACQLQDLSSLQSALQLATQHGSHLIAPQDVSHIDLAENELQETGDLKAYFRLLSLDISKNSVTEIGSLPITLLHLKAEYNHLESANMLQKLTALVELSLGYNLLTSVACFERLCNLEILLLPGNRISTLHGLSALSKLGVLDLKFNYIDRVPEVRLLALNAKLRSLSLGGNAVAKLPTYRSSTIAILPALLTLDGEKMPRSSVSRRM